MEARHEEILRYVRFTPEDRERLRSVAALVEPHLPRVAGEFYDRIREHADAHAVLRDEPQVDRLTRSLESWLRQIFVGAYDAPFFERSARVGRVHVEVGLPQRYMLTAAGVIRTSIGAILEEHPARSSFDRALDAQLAVMLDAYAERYVERIQKAEVRGPDPHEPVAHASLALMDQAQLLVVGVDHRGDVALVSDEVTRVTGFARDELLGRPLTRLAGDDDGRLGAALRRVLDDQHPVADADVELRDRTGRPRTVHFRLVRPAVSKATLAALVLGRDVTDERALAERTRQNERLASVGTLAAGLAHEIRNPLNGAHLAVTFLERALRRAGLGRDAMDAVETIDHEISRLSALVTEFLQFARPQPIVKTDVSLSEICRRVVSLLESDAARARVALALDLPTTDVRLEADGDKLVQVLLNLGKNAIEAIAETHRDGSVTLRLRRTPRRAIVQVKDDGPGLPSSGAPIFDAFYSTKPAGTGLGLSIAHRIVMDHHGEIDVESTPAGTSFQISLPLGPPGPGSRERGGTPT